MILHSVSSSQIHSNDDNHDNDKVHAKKTAHEIFFSTFHAKMTFFGLMLQQKSAKQHFLNLNKRQSNKPNLDSTPSP